MPTNPTRVSFEVTVQKAGSQLIVLLPADASEELPSRGQVAVTGTINGHQVDVVIEPDGMRGHWLRLPSELGVTEGDLLGCDFSLAETWPEPQVPEDLRKALAEHPPASELWEQITPMARWEWVRWVQATKNPATSSKRVDVTISKLTAGKRRPCCFDLSSCTDPELAKSGKLSWH